MGQPPAVVIIVRHGARLDAADTQWHLTSPTPYDPPLTYGGWKQAQALGARIGSIIKFREDAAKDLQGAGHSHQHSHDVKGRRHKVVIHTSPFLRCVQTSIALSAGMDHWMGKVGAEAEHDHPRHHMLHSGSPHVHTLDPRNSPRLNAIPEPVEDNPRKTHASEPEKFNKLQRGRTLLRVDALLGEWMTPDYFANITPPPGSKMMVAAAKADLLRRGDPIETVLQRSGIQKNGNFPGGWTNNHVSLDGPQNPGNTNPTITQEAEQNPKLARAKTHSAIGSGRRGHRRLSSWVEGDKLAESAGYSPPTPSYALSPAQPIPQGYVAHARNACVSADYQWDSMRPPLEWGGGGDYGEEWSSMHRRFRKALHDIVSWYRDHEASQEPEDSTNGFEELHHAKSLTTSPQMADGEETVLVLVTHGAGCNALIGALTNQPALIDVGLASLTMAVRKDAGPNGSLQPYHTPSSPSRRRSSIDPGTSDDYDVKLMASTDHLRPGSHFLGGPPARARSPSLPIREKSPYRYERHVGSPTRQHLSSSPAREKHNAKPPQGSVGSFEEDKSLGGIMRANTTAGSNGGLWSMPSNSKSGSRSPNGASKVSVPKLDIAKDNTRGRTSNDKLESTLVPNVAGTLNKKGELGSTQPALWKADSTTAGTGIDKSKPKRRWTLDQA